jgi:hypothetical protein
VTDLIAAWEFGPCLYQVWEMEDEYLCQCVYLPTLETVWEAGGSTAAEAIAAGVREALRGLS